MPLGLIARWALATSDGDIQGGDLPGWFAELFGAATVLSLADRRGECIHAACPHWNRCFVEHTIRRARTRASGGGQPRAGDGAGGVGRAGRRHGADPLRVRRGPSRVRRRRRRVLGRAVGAETAELRRWLLGAEGGRSRARGLAAAARGSGGRPAGAGAPLDAALQAARALPAPGWWRGWARTTPSWTRWWRSWGRTRWTPTANPTEAFLRLVRRQVLARVVGDGEPGLARPGAAGMRPVSAVAGLAEAAERLARALGRIVEPLETLRVPAGARGWRTRRRTWTPPRGCGSRRRAGRSGRRAIDPLTAWRAMLRALAEPPAEPGQRPQHVMFLRLDRRDGREIGMSDCIGIGSIRRCRSR